MNVVLIGMIAAMAIMLLVLAGGMAYAIGEPRRRLRRRMDGLGLHRGEGGDFGDTGGGRRGSGGDNQIRQRRIQEKLKELEKDKEKRAKRRNRIRLALLRAGLRIDHRAYFMMTIILGLVAGLAVFIAGFQPLVAALVGITAAFGLPRMVLGFMAGRRQKKFTREFSNALDVMVRGVRSGLPVSECISIVGREVPDPVGEEFRVMLEGQRVGMALSEIMARGLERMPTAEYKFFAIVLQIQQQTGGNLAETLENLSTVIRERKQMRQKVKALASEAKTSAWIIGSLPFCVAGLVSLISPEYMDTLFSTSQGHLIIGLGAVMYVTGIGIMAKMINFKI
jgi:tight adherence protein B